MQTFGILSDCFRATLGLHKVPTSTKGGSKGAYEPISVPNVCSEHLETASLYFESGKVFGTQNPPKLSQNVPEVPCEAVL